MSRFIASARNPQWPAQEPELRALFGVTGGKWPDRGCPPRCIQGIWVRVLPVDHASLVDLNRKGKRSQHRCLATCPDCGAQVSAGRLQQHRCNSRVNKTERLRRWEFQRTLAWTRTQARLRELAIAAIEEPKNDDAVSSFCEVASDVMTPEQRHQWDNMAAQETHEIVNEALRILGMHQQTVPATT